MDATTINEARSLLFVPGSRPDRFDKAVDSGADVVVLDLEDAVAPGDKVAARDHVVGWLAAGGIAAVRINAQGTDWCDADVVALSDLGCAVMVPKAEDPAALSLIAGRTEAAIIALIETALGVQQADVIAAAGGVSRIALGTMDLAVEIGVDPTDWSALGYARGRLVVASAAAGLAAPIDGVTVGFRDESLVAADTSTARALGFGGKLCIHPDQISVVHAAFRPADRDLRWAERVLTATDDGNGGAVAVDGAMVDPPVIARARALIARAR